MFGSRWKPFDTSARSRQEDRRRRGLRPAPPSNKRTNASKGYALPLSQSQIELASRIDGAPVQRPLYAAYRPDPQRLEAPGIDPKAASTGPIWLPRSSRSGQATVQTIWQRLRCCCGCSMCRRSHRNLCGAPWTWSHCWVVDLLGRDSHAVDGLSRSPGKLNTRWHGPARERERDHRRRPAAAPRDRHPTACRRMPRHVHNPPRGSGGSLTSPPSKMLT
jgi:hypothetical protein